MAREWVDGLVGITSFIGGTGVGWDASRTQGSRPPIEAQAYKRARHAGELESHAKFSAEHRKCVAVDLNGEKQIRDCDIGADDRVERRY